MLCPVPCFHPGWSRSISAPQGKRHWAPWAPLAQPGSSGARWVCPGVPGCPAPGCPSERGGLTRRGHRGEDALATRCHLSDWQEHLVFHAAFTGVEALERWSLLPPTHRQLSHQDTGELVFLLNLVTAFEGDTCMARTPRGTTKPRSMFANQALNKSSISGPCRWQLLGLRCEELYPEIVT